VFRKNEFQLRFLILSISDGIFKYGNDQFALSKDSSAGTQFTYQDIINVQPDFSNNGRNLDFSGEKNYPFPFKILLGNRPLVLASKTR